MEPVGSTGEDDPTAEAMAFTTKIRTRRCRVQIALYQLPGLRALSARRELGVQACWLPEQGNHPNFSRYVPS
jgi:hypothetical protein